jgi:hypothetical protein
MQRPGYPTEPASRRFRPAFESHLETRTTSSIHLAGRPGRAGAAPGDLSGRRPGRAPLHPAAVAKNGTPTMFSLLAYGSLIHPAELARHALDRRCCTPVRVRGFRRSFSQEPSWRPAVSEARAVLTLQRSANDWINALLVQEFDDDALAELDIRERGYIRTPVPPERIQPYATAGWASPTAPVAYLGRAAKHNPRLLPSEEYLELCLAGAAAWGPEFLTDFVATTFVQERRTLLEHRPGLAVRPPRPQSL